MDRLVRDYLAWSSEALDVLVALYDAVERGLDVPPEAARIADRIGAWEGQLSEVLVRVSSVGTGGAPGIAVG